MNKQGGADDQNINQSKLRRIGFTSYDGTAVTHTAPYIASFPFSLFLAFFPLFFLYEIPNILFIATSFAAHWHRQVDIQARHTYTNATLTPFVFFLLRLYSMCSTT